jgi:serine/threonine-protein kinase
MTTQAQAPEDPQTTRARSRVGMVLQDRWTLDALLGVGGMAAVYAATHRNGKRVAVKMLHAEFSHDDEVRTRFLREGYAANTIQHDGAVSVLDDALAPDGSAFLVMELLEGETVEQRWEKRGYRLPVTEVLFIVDQLLDVLHAAHEKSVVHRDVKPENLFITRAGVLKVLDFGIARVFERQPTRSTSTRAGMVMGTPAFMAPEQARARWDEVDGRTDLWAVGATMFTLLSGHQVHEAVSNHEQLIMSATEPARRLQAVAPDVPESVASIVDRALAFDRGDRWPDARTMQHAVRVVLDSDETLPAGVLASAPLASPDSPARGTRVDPGVVVRSGTASAVSSWTRERDFRQGEVAKLRASVGELQQSLTAAKKATGEAQGKVEAAQTERASLEQWFDRRVGPRTAAVQEARADVRRNFVAIARRALGDRAFGSGALEAERDRISTLERAADSAARDVTVHESALRAYDPAAFRRGLVVGTIAAILAVAVVAAPIVWRATRVIEPPPPKTAAPR